MFKKIPYLVIYHRANFDDLIESSLRVIQKIKFASLCKPIHNVMIIPVSSKWPFESKGRGKRSFLEEFLGKGVLKTCSKFTG